MAAQNVTQAALLDVQARFTEIFGMGQSTPSRYERVSHVQTAVGMLANHTANVSPIVDTLGNCLGFRAYHLHGADSTLDYDGDGSDLSLSCDIVSGDGLQATETIYDFNLRKVKTRTVNDALCGNLFRDGVSQNLADEAATLVAENLFYGMQAIHNSLNLDFINFLDTNRTGVNNDTNLPTGIAYSGTTYLITENTLSTQNPDTLTDVETIALNNDLTNWFMVAGRKHFYNAFINSQYKVLNDDQRSEARWGQTPLFFDVKSLDSTLSGANSFVIDPGSYIFYDHVDSALTELPYQVEDNHWEFIINDPILVMNTPSGVRPLRYTVRYQKVCNTVNTGRMRSEFLHNFQIILNAGLHTAPPATDGHTGILKFKSA